MQIKITHGQVRSRRLRKALAVVLSEVRLLAVTLLGVTILSIGAAAVGRLLWTIVSKDTLVWSCVGIATVFAIPNFIAQALVPILIRRFGSGNSDWWLRRTCVVSACQPSPVAILLSLGWLAPAINGVDKVGSLLWLALVAVSSTGTWLGWRVAQSLVSHAPFKPPIRITGALTAGSLVAQPVSRNEEDFFSPPAPSPMFSRPGAIGVTLTKSVCAACGFDLDLNQRWSIAKCRENPEHVVHKNCVALTKGKCPKCGNGLR